ncbi:heme/hemin ABC transporter substrate-binding protein [Blastochloris sulfoviridis]|uniref:ABC transporter substrate-binding protein n=1 Tax=Blastochloris sulfoviridis TaxID=50712 RepID=A0A5M6I2D1_9HYPH|nr:ABC transporter substrate-binding protein [Blastochloris sulfoviridis]KAA5601975.1 ABC transporter substrate-binding protein [Blastochloris sulfoviridis]
MRTLAARIAVLTGLVLSGLAIALPATSATAAGATSPDASRIVSVGAAITEILYALGLDGRVVAVDATSQFPARALQEKPSVGYLRQLSAEGVLGTNPSLVLAAAAAGPPETVRVLEAAAVPLVRVPDSYDGAGILAKIRLIAATAGAEARGVCLAAAVAGDLDALAGLGAKVTAAPRVVFLLSFVNGRAMVAGRGTAADGLIRLAGAANVFDSLDGYKPVTDEAIVAARPDTVIVMDTGGIAGPGGAGMLTADRVFAHAGFAATPAAEHRAFRRIEAQALAFGPITARAALDLAQALHPDLAAAPRPPTPDCSR